MRFVIFGLALVLTGCVTAPRQFHNPNVTQEQAKRDALECRYDAKKVEASQANPIIAVDMANQAYNMCMEIRGYR
ncbi:hypothetical protein [Noviherbaspirillum sp. UKPF54]|uniref:hypothetical protein n=1 Tax=Noviherbaspirillum sp. UKPF54 TaxID=2601898 RepID=UPI0011B143B5|nr:hypothetical protein [Noviherbaspirillum sp. UKPF54]QDZ29060.1 hypothetical protein FAY22_14515 [Noviherbaspirillum sp. UKPF54]